MLFVAGFIGTPQMNFFEAELSCEDDNYFIIFNGHTINLSKEYVKSLNQKILNHSQ